MWWIIPVIIVALVLIGACVYIKNKRKAPVILVDKFNEKIQVPETQDIGVPKNTCTEEKATEIVEKVQNEEPVTEEVEKPDEIDEIIDDLCGLSTDSTEEPEKVIEKNETTSAMTLYTDSNCTRAQLIEFCRSHGKTGISRLSKIDLLNMANNIILEM